MPNIIYNKQREKNIRDTDLGRVLKIIDRLIKHQHQTKKENRSTGINLLREARRRIKNNNPK